mmetsp:Transcript_57072/g.161117  ORF Transcript_57072/g.161117 Transcript_57072/m.161117 type:complete len:208 (-) Transcript_57072:125-748(-)
MVWIPDEEWYAKGGKGGKGGSEGTGAIVPLGSRGSSNWEGGKGSSNWGDGKGGSNWGGGKGGSNWEGSKGGSKWEGGKGGSNWEGGKGGSNWGGSDGGWKKTWQPEFQKKGGKGGGYKGNNRVNPTKTIWAGNLPDGLTYQELKAHAEQSGSPKFAKVFSGKSSGTGAVGYGTTEEVEAAVLALNGTMLKGAAILADPWEKKANTEA